MCLMLTHRFASAWLANDRAPYDDRSFPNSPPTSAVRQGHMLKRKRGATADAAPLKKKTSSM